MSFEAYLANIKEKTGKTPDDFKALAESKGLLEPGVKAGQIVTWLKQDFGLGHGHAMAIVSSLQSASAPEESPEQRLEKHFSGAKAAWRPSFDLIVSRAKTFGPDVHLHAGGTYITLLKGEKKFAIIATSGLRLDVGIKLKGVASDGRFESSGSWNAMVTHRVRISRPDEVDQELYDWLERAYQAA